MLRAFLALTIVAAAANVTGASGAKVTITQRALLPLCVNASPAGDRAPVACRSPERSRRWLLTMNNRPRPGVKNEAPGVATISFVSENGHQYEIEIRADTLDILSPRVAGAAVDAGRARPHHRSHRQW